MGKSRLHMNRFAALIAVILTALALFCLLYLFYQHVTIALVGSLLSIFAIPLYRRYVNSRQQRELASQFQQLLYSLSSALAAGRSVENAFLLAEQDLRMFYQSSKTLMIDAIHTINKRVKNGESIERSFLSFSNQSNLQDIQNFAEIFGVCKRSGGDLVEVIRRTANLIAEKMEVEQEILIMTAHKRFEARMMAVVPILLIALLAYSSPDYMSPLYTGIGRVLMTFVLLCFGCCYWWMTHIMSMKV
jgi:tight adherence protein B